MPLLLFMKPIILLGEAPSAPEAKLNISFCSAGGIELLRMLDEAKVISLTAIDTDYIRRYWQTTDPELIDMVWRLHESEIIRQNVFTQPFPSNNIENICGLRIHGIPGHPALIKGTFGYVSFAFQPDLTSLANTLNHIDPNLVIALGNTPLWALCGTTGVAKLRGTTRLSTHTVADFKVLATYHPTAVLRQFELRSVTVFDLIKAVRENQSPDLLLPEREIWIEPSIADIEEYYENHIRGTDLLSVDIETAGNQVTCIGFAPSSRSAIVIPFYDGRRKNHSYFPDSVSERRAWVIVSSILGDRTIPKLFQNEIGRAHV